MRACLISGKEEWVEWEGRCSQEGTGLCDSGGRACEGREGLEEGRVRGGLPEKGVGPKLLGG